MENLANDVINFAKKNGADSAELALIETHGESSAVRLGKLEGVSKANGTTIGLRIIIGKKQAIISSNKITINNYKDFVMRGIDMAHVSTNDEFLSVANSGMFANNFPELELYDSYIPSTKELVDYATEIEETALDNKLITNSEGAEVSYSKTKVTLALNGKFSYTYDSSSYSAALSLIAGKDADMQTEYEYVTKRFYNNMPKPSLIGEKAAKRTISKLNPIKINSQKIPVIFDPRIGKSILSNFLSAINGANICRNASFLKDYMNKNIFPGDIEIIDEPHIKKGLSSKPFDGEGLPTQKLNLVTKGILENWLLDLRSAKQLQLIPSGNASRGTNSLPSPSASNAYLRSLKNITSEELIKNTSFGLYVTEIFGMGVNLISGDYSQGVFGYLIEKGEITKPVHEVTIASNLKNMFANIIAANDLEFVYSINTPTLLIDNMTLAGR